MALALVEADLGAATANLIARHFVLYARRPGYQSQFSPLLQAQTAAEAPFAALIDWMQANLDQPLDVPALAARAGLLLAGVLLSATSAFSQQGATEIRGKVVDAQGAAVPGATVIVKNQDTGMFRETVSNVDGTYFVSGIVPGVYEVSAELQGFKKLGLKDIRLEIGKTSTVDLQLAVGGIEEVVTVSAESPLVDVTTKEVGGNITGSELVDLPSINRNFIGFIGLLPGIVPSISTESFGSTRFRSTAPIRAATTTCWTAATTTTTSSASAQVRRRERRSNRCRNSRSSPTSSTREFGRTTGAIINAVTKSGTNVFHGSAFVFGQDADWTAKDYFAKERNLPKPDTQRREFGGTIGGPIVKDKAHFFFSLERVMIDRGAAMVIPARPDLNWSPTTQDRVWNTMVKFDQQFNANHTWGVRWLRELSPQRNQAITPPLITPRRRFAKRTTRIRRLSQRSRRSSAARNSTRSAPAGPRKTSRSRIPASPGMAAT